MKKALSLIMTLGMSLTMLASCAQKPTSNSLPASTSVATSTPVQDSNLKPADGPVEVSFSWWGSDARHEATQKAVDAFTAKNTTISVKNNYGAWTGWEDAMSTALYSGTAQDLNQVNWNWIFNYETGSNGNTFVDLNTLSEYIDLTQFDAKALEQCTVNGRLAAVPVAMTGRIFFWNASAFKKAGIEVPKSYDDLLKAGETFKTKIGNDAYPLVMGEYDRMIFLVWALECKYGKDWVVDGKLNYTKDEIVEGLKIFEELEKAHAIPSIKTIAGDGAESLDKNPKWMDGKYGGIFEWDSAATKFQKALNEGNEFIVGDYLTGFGDHKGGFTKVSLGFAITESAANKVEAAMLMEYLLNDEEGTKLLNSQRGIPLSQKALKACQDEDLLEDVVTEANQRVMQWCSNKLDPTFEDAKLKANDGVYYDALAGHSYGDYTAEDAADVLIEGITGVLNS